MLKFTLIASLRAMKDAGKTLAYNRGLGGASCDNIKALGQPVRKETLLTLLDGLKDLASEGLNEIPSGISIDGLLKDESQGVRAPRRGAPGRRQRGQRGGLGRGHIVESRGATPRRVYTRVGDEVG